MPSKRKKREPWRTVKNGSVEVPIYRQGDGYRVVWYAAGDMQRKYRTDAAEAVEFAQGKAAELAGKLPATETEAIDIVRHHRQLEEKAGVPLHVAIAYFVQNNKRAEMTVIDAKTKDLLKAFKEQLQDDKKSPSYVGMVETYLGPFVKSFPGIINEIASDQMDEWLRKRTKSQHTRWHTSNYLKTFFNWARDAKRALPKGETQADALSFPKPDAAEIEIYTPEEMRLLFDFAQNDEERALLALGGFAGLRNSEITGERTDHGALPIESINFEEAAVKVVQKVRRKSVVRYAPLTDNALTWLNALRNKSGPVVSFATASIVLNAIIARANAAGHEIEFKRNGLRRSHISYRTAITRDVPRVADECNTSPAKIRANYRKPGLEKVAHAYYAISRLVALEDPADPRPSSGDTKPEVQSAKSSP